MSLKTNVINNQTTTIAERNETLQDYYARFLAAFFDGFSEDDVDCYPKQVERTANTLACFLAGEPDVVGPDLQNATLDLKRRLRREDPLKIEAVAKDLVLFQSFIRAQQQAHKHRLAGNVARALGFEQTAQWAYKQMSDGFRW